MGAAVVSSTWILPGSPVVHWHRSVTELPIVSASRNAVMVHGDVFVDDDLERMIAGAKRAHEDLRAGRTDEALAVVTHERDMFRELVPVKREPAEAQL